MSENWTPDAEVLAAAGKKQQQEPPPFTELGATGTTGTMAENIAHIIHLDSLIEKAELEIKVLVEKRNAIAEVLKEQFVDAEIQNVKVMGRTIFLHRSVYCNVPAENMEQIIKVLDAEGMGDVAPRFASTAKLKGLLKEDETKWKEKFGDLIKTGERYDIRNRSAS